VVVCLTSLVSTAAHPTLMTNLPSDLMLLQLDLQSQEFLSLEDVIAYEFFMESVGKTMNSAHEENMEIVEALVKLAKASYMVAGIFCEARLIYSQQDNDSDT
jgi:hypothetical protein